MEKQKIQVIDTGVEVGTSVDIYDCESIEDVKAKIEEIYHSDKNDVVIGEMLSSIQVVGLSIPEVVELYSNIMHEHEGDILIQIYGDHGSEELHDEIENAIANGDACEI